MGKWVKSLLGAIGPITKGSGISRDQSHSGELPAVRYGEIYTHHNEYVKDYVSRISNEVAETAQPTHRGDILFAGSGETPDDIGKCVALLDDGVFAGGDLVIFSPPDGSDPVYWGSLLNIPYVQKQKAMRAQGSSIYHIRPDAIKKIEVVYDSDADEQRHIAEILTTCDEVIEKTEAVVEKYRAIKAGMLKDLFTRGIGKNGKLRPPPESAPQHYKDTALGKVPREWEVKSFDSAFELHGNNTLSRAFLTNQNGVVRNVHYGDVLVKYDTILDCDDEALPSVIAEGVRQAGNDYLQNCDLVFADTAEDDTVGKAVELYNVGDRTIVSGLHTIFARPKEDDFASRWLGYYVNSDSFHKQLLPFVVGSKVSSISRTNIKRTFVVIPESDEQQRIAERLSAIDAKIADELAVVAKYRRVRAGLMARLLTPPDMEVE